MRITPKGDKAARLITEDRILEIIGDIRAFAVEGDHGSYLVTAVNTDGEWSITCTCPAVVKCSHQIAVWLTVTAPEDPFEGIV